MKKKDGEYLMEFKQLEAFVAVVDYNSFTEAARHLYLTQPTISAHILALEKELNSRLIIRTTKQLTVTRRGFSSMTARSTCLACAAISLKNSPGPSRRSST